MPECIMSMPGGKPPMPPISIGLKAAAGSHPLPGISIMSTGIGYDPKMPPPCKKPLLIGLVICGGIICYYCN